VRTSRRRAEDAATAPHINAFYTASQSLTTRGQTRPGEPSPLTVAARKCCQRRGYPLRPAPIGPSSMARSSEFGHRPVDPSPSEAIIDHA
jgi:hypothetical protein